VAASHGSNGASTQSYTITAGGTPFVAGDTFVFDSKRLFGVFGASREVVLDAADTLGYGSPGWQTTSLEYLDNEAACCAHSCALSSPFVRTEAGGMYGPAAHQGIGIRADEENTDQFVIEGMNLWKAGYAGIYQNEADHPRYLGWTVAGGRGRISAGGIAEMIQGVAGGGGAGPSAMFDACSFFPKTLDDYFSADRPNIMVSYGGGVIRKNCLFVPVAATTITLESGTVRPIMVENGSTMRLWDLYNYGLETTFQSDTGNFVAGADPGYYGMRWPPIFMTATNYPATTYGASYTALAGDIRLPWSQGNAGAFLLPADGSLFRQAGGYWVHDHPMFLYGTTGSVYAQSNASYPNMNGKLVSSTYRYVNVRFNTASGRNINNSGTATRFDLEQTGTVLTVSPRTDWGTASWGGAIGALSAPSGIGVGDAVLAEAANLGLGYVVSQATGTTGSSGTYNMSMSQTVALTYGSAQAVIPITYTRLQADGVTPVTDGTWHFPHGDNTGSYSNMRHCAVLTRANGGTAVDVSWSRDDLPLPTSLNFNIRGMINAADDIVLAIDWDTGAVPTLTTATIANPELTGTLSFTTAGVSSLATLLSATANRYWMDTANDKLYLHIWGGLVTQAYASDADLSLRKQHNILTIDLA
jgi:hypothetical protein